MKYLIITLLAVALVSCRTNLSPEQQARDLQATAQVKAKLATDLGPQTVTNIDVNTTNGVVTLSGTVNSAEAKSKAGSIAQGAPHVSSVQNNLQIVSGG